MSGKRNWLVGCGVGCLVVVLIVVVGGVMVFRAGKQVVARFDEVSRSQTELVRLHGGVRDYVPPADGRLASGRVETFLRVQDAIAAEAVELAAHAETLRELEEGGSRGPRALVHGVRSVIGLGKAVGAYLEARNAALLAEGMGFGEYSYLYAIVYHAYLDRDLRPVFSLHDQEDLGPRYVRLQVHFRAWLQSQREAAAAAGEDAAWLNALDDEILALSVSDLRVPWRDGLPERTAAVLAPYRDRIEASFLPLGPLLCIGAETSGGGFDFQVQ
jgi:hypothetical protein